MKKLFITLMTDSLALNATQAQCVLRRHQVYIEHRVKDTLLLSSK